MTKTNILNKMYLVMTITILFLWFSPFILLFYISVLKTSSLYEITWDSNFLFHNHKYNFDQYLVLLENKQFLLSAFNTLVISCISTTLVISFAIGIAYYLYTMKNFSAKKYSLFIIFLLIAIPVQITFNSNTWIFNKLHIYNSIFSIVLVHIALGLPFIVVIIYNSLRRIPQNIQYLAIIDDLNSLQKLMYVYLPLTRRSIINITIYQIIWIGNDLIVGMTFGDEQSKPLTTFVQGQVRQFGDAYKTILPATILSTCIPIILGIFLLRSEKRK